MFLPQLSITIKAIKYDTDDDDTDENDAADDASDEDACDEDDTDEDETDEDDSDKDDTDEDDTDEDDTDEDDFDKDDTERMPVMMTVSRAYLAALAAMNAVVEARGLVPAHPAEHAVVTVEFWGREQLAGGRGGHTTGGVDI